MNPDDQELLIRIVDRDQKSSDRIRKVLWDRPMRFEAVRQLPPDLGCLQNEKANVLTIIGASETVCSVALREQLASIQAIRPTCRLPILLFCNFQQTDLVFRRSRLGSFYSLRNPCCPISLQWAVDMSICNNSVEHPTTLPQQVFPEVNLANGYFNSNTDLVNDFHPLN